MKEVKFKVGDVVAVKLEDNLRRINKSLDNIDEWCFQGKVVKVGRRYITVEFKKKIDGYILSEVFDKENNYKQKHEIGYAEYGLYTSKEKVIEELEVDRLFKYIKRNFEYSNKYTLIQLNKIKKIIEE